MLRINGLAFAMVALLVLVAAPAMATDIRAGFDFWQTVGSGATQYDFAEDPIPPDFFCSGSEKFSGKVTFTGVPLATTPANLLGSTDTIVERLNSVTLDANGFGTTQIRVRAVHLKGRETITNKCGTWTVEAYSAGSQPRTTMSIQESELCPETGYFTADLVINVEIAFSSGTDTVTLNRTVSLPSAMQVPYARNVAATNCPPSVLPSGQYVQVHQDNFQVYSADNFTTGCGCNCEGTICLPLIEEHNGELHELHFVMEPCEFFGWGCEPDPEIYQQIRSEMQRLYDEGRLDEDVDTATYNFVHATQ